MQLFKVTCELAHQLVAEQFPGHAHLGLQSVEKQRHDNRTYRLGSHMMVRLPTAESYALKVPQEQEWLPKLAPRLSVKIPVPLHMGRPSEAYPFPFSIYKWLEGTSLNLLSHDFKNLDDLAFDLTKFLKELQSLTEIEGPAPGQHNWWRGDHISVYNKEAFAQIAKLGNAIDTGKARALWARACSVRWMNPSVGVHGDLAIGNLLIQNGKLSAVIDFGGTALGDPACDLVIAWTFFYGKARDIFIKEVDLDEDTWLRAKAWALWKATFELCQIQDKKSPIALAQKRVIEQVLA